MSEESEVPVAKRQRVDQEVAVGLSLYQGISKDLRLRILSYASPFDLAEFACVSRQSRLDCRDPTLPQERWAVISSSGSIYDLLYKLKAGEMQGRFQRFRYLKLRNANLLLRENTEVVRQIFGRNRIRGVTRLDMSLSTNTRTKKERQVAACVPKSMAKIMPHLKEVDLSNINVSQSAISDFAKRCPLLEMFHWHNCKYASAFVTGQDFKACRNLKEIHMNDANFYASQYQIAAMEEDGDKVACLFYFVRETLERVSIQNAACHSYGQKSKPVTQKALMKFVRSAPNLKWFQSDLTLDNIAILQVERPGIVFL